MSTPSAPAPVTERAKRQRGPRILVWGPDAPHPHVERPAIALGARTPKPRHPGGRPTVVALEVGALWTGRGSAAYESDLPPAPRVRCASRRHGRDAMREEVRRTPGATFLRAKRIRSKGGQLAHRLLGRAHTMGLPVTA